MANGAAKAIESVADHESVDEVEEDIQAVGKNDERFDAYEELVSRRAEEADGTTFLNRTARHAVEIFTAIFLKAENHVCILSGKLNEDVYGHEKVIAAALEFLRKKDTVLRVLHEEPIADDHPLIRALELGGIKASHWCLHQVSKELQETYNFHFAIADGRHLRFEEDRDNFEAIVQFGGDDNGIILTDNFEQLWEACTATER